MGVASHSPPLHLFVRVYLCGFLLEPILELDGCVHTYWSSIYRTLNKEREREGGKNLNILICSVPREGTPRFPSLSLSFSSTHFLYSTSSSRFLIAFLLRTDLHPRCVFYCLPQRLHILSECTCTSQGPNWLCRAFVKKKKKFKCPCSTVLMVLYTIKDSILVIQEEKVHFVCIMTFQYQFQTNTYDR